ALGVSRARPRKSADLRRVTAGLGTSLPLVPIQLLASFTTWSGWDTLVAIGTLMLAAATFALVLTTRRSVTTAAQQITLERRNAEWAQWPRVIPAGPSDWATFQGRYGSPAGTASMLLPVKNLGPGVAYNVRGFLEFDAAYGGGVHVL